MCVCVKYYYFYYEVIQYFHQEGALTHCAMCFVKSRKSLCTRNPKFQRTQHTDMDKQTGEEQGKE